MDVDANKLVEKYIKKVDSEPMVEQKMTRNLQPEIEKIKSVNLSVREMYINSSERARLLDAINALKSAVEAGGSGY